MRQTIKQQSIRVTPDIKQALASTPLHVCYTFSMESCGRTSFFVKVKGPQLCAGSPFKVTGCPQTRLSLQNSKRVILLQ